MTCWYYKLTEPGLWTVMRDTEAGPVTDDDFDDRDKARRLMP